MDRPVGDNSLGERIRSARCRVVVLWGPAACGKTSAALGVYRDFMDDSGRAHCLLLAPNAPAAQRLRRRLLAESPHGVVVSPAVLTFSALAGRILSAAGSDARAIGAFERNLLLRRIVDDLDAAGRLTALKAVADTPGLVTTLDQAIAELKRAAIDPRDLARAVGRRAGKNRDLLEIYTRYQDHLQEARLYDVEGLTWLARDCLRERRDADTPPPGLEGVQAIAVDGFTDFTPTQLEILKLLAGRARRVLITLCCADDTRSRMWHWARRTLNNVRHAFGEDLQEMQARCADDPPLAAIWRRVFDLDAEPCAAPPGLSVVAAGGIDAEVAAAARRAKRLLLEGAPAGSIAVTARSMDAYRPAIERIFARHDVPVSPAPQPLTDVPIVRFLLDAAGLAPQFDFQNVLGVIKNSYFLPEALGGFNAGTVATAEMLIRTGNVLHGRAAYADAAQRLARRMEAQPPAGEEEDDQPPRLGPIESSPQAVEAAGAMLGKLFDLAERAQPRAADADGEQPNGATAPCDGVLALAGALHLHQAARRNGDPVLIARDLRALAALAGALGAGREPITSLGHLREALSCVACPPHRAEAVVDCLDVLDTRAMRYRHVLCLGVGEGHFPRRLGERSLVNEADRLAWAAHGVKLDSRLDLAAREMLLFYLAVSRADETLTLSYLESDSSGSAGAPSSFLLSLLEPVGGLEGLGVCRIPPGEFLPPDGELCTRRDAVTAAVAGLFREDLGRRDDALRWAAANAGESLLASAGGLWARHRRWTPDECDAFDGRLDDPALLDALARRYPREVVFSASRLNTYGQCPWQYFAQYVLRLEPLGEPQRRLEPTARGSFVHNVLCRLMRDLRATQGQEVRLAGIDESALREALDRAVAAEAQAVGTRPVPYPLLWRAQLDRMREEMLAYLLDCRGRDELESAMLHFELGFAAEDDPAHEPDPASVPDPIALPTDAGGIRVRGKIDRVDRVRFGDRGGLLVVDYKTGSLPAVTDITEGRNVQLVVYAAAAEAILKAECLGGAFHRVGPPGATSRQFFAAMKLSRGRYSPMEDFPEQRQAVLETIRGFVEGMRRGRFDMAPTHDCPSYCPYRQICQYSPARARVKGAAEAREDNGGPP